VRRKLYQIIAGAIAARENCRKSGNTEWFVRHEETIEKLTREHMPSGGGFDNPTTLDLDNSTADRLRFKTAFHHMDDHGYYAGWSYHPVTVTPSLANGFELVIGGRDRNQIKDYIAETFHAALSRDFEVRGDEWRPVPEQLEQAS
jgi:hypothetical protein